MQDSRRRAEMALQHISTHTPPKSKRHPAAISASAQFRAVLGLRYTLISKDLLGIIPWPRCPKIKKRHYIAMTPLASTCLLNALYARRRWQHGLFGPWILSHKLVFHPFCITPVMEQGRGTVFNLPQARILQLFPHERQRLMLVPHSVLCCMSNEV